MFASAWQIASAPRGSWKDPSILANLHLNNTIPIPSAADIPPNNALVRIRAVGINARDMMVISHGLSFAFPSYHVLSQRPLSKSNKS